VTLLLSDVIGDRLDVIGSGPTVPDLSTFQDALDVVDEFRLQTRLPGRVLERLKAGIRGEIAENPKPGDSAFQRVQNVVVASNSSALAAAAAEAKNLGYVIDVLSSEISGEARELGRTHGERLRRAEPGSCLLSGGETTVTVKGEGKGGRNQEFALALALEVAGLPNLGALCAGTDGTDGPTDAAGAFVTGGTVAQASSKGMDAGDYLIRNDAYNFFSPLGALVKTGATGTNVMDINIMLSGRRN
jgi:hydroxypyruvate reductase